jgi:DNA primase large subunit
MGARAWIAQADTQLMLAKRGKSEEEELEEGGFRLESRFVLATGKLRDGGAEVVEVLRISSRLREDRALLEAEIVNEGEVETGDERTAAMLDEIAASLVEAAEPMRKRNLAASVGVKPDDRTFTRALEVGIESGRFNRPKRGTYALGEAEDD